ncbi:hypothetical protein MKX07_000111 [Trichoderma sp. CBMAI-0711]|uniref:Secreted protein n=1 Tax=Trichoderma parareesei TaxID=858221 RepID=A0A2H2ZI42_TRIPA|nr:hypothetical protein MKX07_000111 [Trichoderma sp. CBMAI-0711]OTA02890.1 secreted protein [Trichoderma parareesei]
MKSAAVAAFGLFAGLASASQPIRHLHFPRSNTTSVAVDDAAPTTLTVIATSVHTVISCAPTVTNCPARLNSTGVGSLPDSAVTPVIVTDTIVLATTVCPVAEASSISSSLQAAHSSGVITGSTIKGRPPAAVTPPPSAGASVTVSDVVTEKTLTYTIGKGADTSVVTTTIKATTQQTITLTSVVGNGGNAQPTTTTTATSTGTTTVTVVPEQSGSGSSGSNTGGDVPPANGEGSCANAATVTVTVAKETVTVPASTVYVTIAPSSCDSGSAPAVTDKGVENGSGSSGSGSGSDSGSDSGSSGSGSDGSGSEGSGSDAAATTPSAVISTPCPTDLTTTVRATVTVQPYPVNNGTAPTGIARPSGFARLRR